jgi:cysteinyl-tRNA synthetase
MGVTLRLHDTAQRRLVAFAPIDPAHVTVYMCGPTVYDLAHIGNMRAFTVADVLVRVLRALHGRVTYVRNITDVEDKISARAAELGVSIGELTERTIAALHADLEAVGNLPPDIEPRVTGHIGEIVALIGELLDRGAAYEAAGHVLYSVPSFPDYGALSGRSPADLLAGARVEVAPYKRHPGDFVLWKPSDATQPGWDSPWGRGRPGWHIECSAMCERHLGRDFDLHLGGEDLIFPHHENERAQSLAAHPGHGFARHWMHNAMLQVDGEKMSKSLGNFLTVRDVLARQNGEVLRHALLRAHYRSVLNFTFEGLAESRRELDRFYRAAALAPAAAPATPPDDVLAPLCDDLNTPEAFAGLHRLANRALAGDAGAAGALRAGGALLGLLGADADAWFRGDADAAAGMPVDDLIAERLDARAARDFARADAIRARLADAGILLEDGPAGTTWRRA